MADNYQFIRGTETENDNYVGPEGSLSVDLDNDGVRLHDGSTAGGTAMQKKEVTTSTGTQSVSEALDRRGPVFDNVADMQASANLTVGTKVRTLGYYEPGDGVGNNWRNERPPRRDNYKHIIFIKRGK